METSAKLLGNLDAEASKCFGAAIVVTTEYCHVSGLLAADVAQLGAAGQPHLLSLCLSI
jgi:hypothetical protein